MDLENQWLLTVMMKMDYYFLEQSLLF